MVWSKDLPGKSVGLIGHRDIFTGAGERPDQCGTGEFRPVVLFAEMCGNDALQARAIDPCQQTGSSFIVEVTEMSGDATLEVFRIAAAREQIDIVIAFEDQTMAPGDHGAHVLGDMTGIGQDGKPDAAIGNHELHRLARVVGNGHRNDLEPVHRQWAVGIEETHLDAAEVELAGRAVGQQDRQSIPRRTGGNTGRVIAVFMGDQNRRQIVGSQIQARQALGELPGTETAIDQQPRCPSLDDEGVAAAATA